VFNASGKNCGVYCSPEINWTIKMSKFKKLVEEVRQANGNEIDLVDKSIASFSDVPGLCK